LTLASKRYGGWGCAATLRERPHGFVLKVDRAGEARFLAQAFDQVGNRAESGLELQLVEG
jgi:hypothetical protein